MNNETRQAIIDGWRYECSCGEQFRTVDAARTCKKCRTYAPDEACHAVVDLLPYALHLTDPVVVWQSDWYRAQMEMIKRADRILDEGENVKFTLGDAIAFR